jgi:stress response protein YsnF
MQQQTVVGVYRSAGVAEDVRHRLINEGVPADAIALRAEQDGSLTERTEPGRDGGGFWDWLFGSDDDEAAGYRAHLQGESTAVSVAAGSPETHRRIVEIMEMYDPVDIEDASTAPGTPSGAGIAASGSSGLAAGIDPAAHGLATTGIETTGTGSDLGSAHIENGEAAVASSTADEEAERVIPVAREELQVGKRATERRYRIRSYVVAHPVEQQVELQDERVVIERRPVRGFRRVEPGSFQEGETEIVERHEEPVASKRAGVVEEVVVRREGQRRVETVRDTVREGRVEVEGDDGQAGPDVTGTQPRDQVRHTE